MKLRLLHMEDERMSTLHMMDDGRLLICFDRVMLQPLEGEEEHQWHKVDGVLWCNVSDCDLKFTFNHVVNEFASPIDASLTRRNVIRGMLRNFIYACGLLLTVIGVYHLP